MIVAYRHLPADELADVLGHGARAVARGGRIIVVGHYVTNITDGIGGQQDPDILYTPATIVSALHGLRIVTAERVTRPVSGEDGTVEAIDTLVSAVRD